MPAPFLRVVLSPSPPGSPILHPSSTRLADLATEGQIRQRCKQARRIGDAAEEERDVEERSGRKVTSRKQAIAIGLSEAREKGAKVPARKSSRKTSRKTAKKRSRM
jgi:hypothetical protein